MNKTITELLKGDVFEEDFLVAFYNLLEKYCNEYNDISQMRAIRQAQALYKTFNE